MKQLLALAFAAGMTLAAFAQSVSTTGVSMNPTNFTVKGSSTNFHIANADRGVATVDTVARLATITNAPNGSVVDVRGYTTEFDWTIPLRYTLNTNSTAATNRFVIANAGNVGRWEYNWNGDIRSFGADSSGSTDSFAAIQAACDFAATSKTNGSFEVKVPGGTYLMSDTLVVVNGQRISLVGETANASRYNNSKFFFTGTNAPIISASGTKLEIRNLALEYETMQGPEATNAIGLLIGSVVASRFENLSIRKAAYCIKDTPSLFHFQNSWRDIYISSFSRAGIRFDRQNTTSGFDNIYVQNASDGQEVSQVAVTGTVVSGTNITFTLASLPTRLRTNMMVTVAGLSPDGLNGLAFITNISGLDVSTAKMTAPGAVVDGVGTLEVTARYCAESPVDIGYGMASIRGLDIEHCIIDDDSALALRNEFSEVSDVHFEQIYPLNNEFSFISGNAASGVNLGSVSIVNSGFIGGTTNYLVWSGFQSSRGDKGSPITIGFLRARDIAKIGATWYPARKSATQYPDLLLLGGFDMEGDARPYGDARFTDENYNMSRPVRMDGGQFSAPNNTLSETMIQLRPIIAQSGNASWTGIHIAPTNTDLAFGSDGGYPFRYTAGGFDRILFAEDGRATFTAGNSNSTGVSTIFRGHDQVYPSSRINFFYGQTNNVNRMNIGGNFMYVQDNTGANQPLYLQLLGSSVIVGSGASGSGLRLGGGANALIQNIQSTTFAWDPGSLAHGASEQTLTSALSAVASNDQILVTLSSIGTNQFVLSAVPTGNTNQVAVTLLNASGGVVDLPSGTLRITVIDF